jgi:pimeloyl-ACP methyl ester carboxylesterase
VVIAVGEASEPFYLPIAAELARMIPGARLVRVPALRHDAPIASPDEVARLVRSVLG